MYFFFFPKGLQLGASLGAHCATLATRLVGKMSDQQRLSATSQTSLCGRWPAGFMLLRPLCPLTFGWYPGQYLAVQMFQCGLTGPHVSAKCRAPPLMATWILESVVSTSQQIANPAHKEGSVRVVLNFVLSFMFFASLQIVHAYNHM